MWRQRTLSNSLWRKPFVCLFCDNKYTQGGKLTRHKIIHNRDWNQRWKRERPHKCKSCEKFFPQTHDLKELTWKVMSRRPLLCATSVKNIFWTLQVYKHNVWYFFLYLRLKKSVFAAVKINNTPTSFRIELVYLNLFFP